MNCSLAYPSNFFPFSHSLQSLSNTQTTYWFFKAKLLLLLYGREVDKNANREYFHIVTTKSLELILHFSL